jgi:TolA-binding protein
MTNRLTKHVSAYRFCVVLFLILLASGCAYFNTFYNARKAFNSAESAYNKQLKKGRQGARVSAGEYRTAIEKSLKILENHPNSKYVDDALYVLGISYFRLEQFSKAERRFRELIANYPESEYVSRVSLPLAKSKIELGDEEEAMTLFEQIFREDYRKELKAEAALALGNYYVSTDEREQALNYYRAVRDSLGSDPQELRAQRSIAEVYFEDYDFGEALGAYLQLLGMNPLPDDRFISLFRAAECSFRMLRIDDGLAYLQELAADDAYFDSLGTVKLKMAEGYEMAEELAAAETMYREVTEEIVDRAKVAEAYYRLGLVYQYDYDDLNVAKEHYDKAAEANRASEWGMQALQKSSDIGKLKQYKNRAELDSTATVESIEQAAGTQYSLAELYWFQLNKADSAIIEMQYLVDSFPDTRIAPRALVALAEMHRDYLLDTTAADSIFREVLKQYPRSDYLPLAMEPLGLVGSAADTGYAGYYFRRAEDFLVDEEQLDSARYYYEYVIGHFPESDYDVQAQFSLLYMDELYALPGDSSLILAYGAFADSFPDSEWGRLANQRLGLSTAGRTDQLAAEEEAGERDERFGAGDEDTLIAAAEPEDDQVGSVVDIEMSRYLRPNGDTVVEFIQEPVLIEQEFEFPTEAYNMEQDQIFLYYHILLDFSGKVIEYELRYPSKYEQMNVNANRTVVSMTFDALEVTRLIDLYGLPPDPSGQGH